MVKVEMKHIRTFGLVGALVLLGGCATHSAYYDEGVDLYLSTLDDKQFVWCQLDLEQCLKDFEEWKGTARGRMIIKEFGKEDSGQGYNTDHLPNVFRTRFVDESQFPKEMIGKEDSGQSFRSDSQESGRSHPSIDKRVEPIQEGISIAPGMYGPEVRP
jgi:hypothetical protein